MLSCITRKLSLEIYHSNRHINSELQSYKEAFLLIKNIIWGYIRYDYAQ